MNKYRAGLSRKMKVVIITLLLPLFACSSAHWAYLPCAAQEADKDTEPAYPNGEDNGEAYSEEYQDEVILEENGNGFPQDEPTDQARGAAQTLKPSGVTLLPESPAAAQQQITAGTQNKVSLDIKGMDIVDVLKMLAQRSGMNIVVGKNVTGRVTLFLKDVDAWDAFELILLANDLAYEQKGNIINVMTQRDYELLYGDRYKDKKQGKIIKLKYAKAADLSRSLSQIKTNIGRVVADEGSNTLVIIDTPEKIKDMEMFIKSADIPIQTMVFNLDYAAADKIKEKIQEKLTKNVGHISMDERTNKVAVTDYPETLEEIGKIIAAFDEKTPQVLIDAQIIQLTPSDLFEMGIDWDFWIEKYFEMRASLPVGTANRLFLGTVQAPTPSAKGEYKSVIDILRTIGDTKVLASPRIMVLNNQEAKIHIGTRDAYITSTTSQAGTGTTVTSQSVNFVDTGIQLFVTPTINRDGFVTMKIKPEVSDSTRTNITSEGQITQIPIVSTSEAETTVMVKDGVTILIGGLRKDKREKTVKKIPLLGDIPGLGFFFRSTSDNLTQTDLVILLTPHIVSGKESILDFSDLKPKDGARAKMEKGKIIIEKIAAETEVESLSTPSQYYSLVADKIKSLASFEPHRGRVGEIKMEFTLSRNGSLVGDPRIIESSNPSLDKLALKAVKEASPFPPFPQALGRKEEIFRINLSYE